MLKLTITTVDEQLFNGEVNSITLPGSDGELTVLKNHTPLITTLKKGKLTLRVRDKEDQCFDIAQGLLEVNRAGAVVLL
jgi:F-type H+-transporting ATPase subunit epsilon